MTAHLGSDRLTDHGVPAPHATGTPTVEVRVHPLTDRHLVRLPDPRSDGIEGLVGQANRRRLTDARRRLGQLGDLILDPDASDTQPLVLSVIDVSVPVDEDAVWNAIDVVARHDDLRPGRITFGLDAARADVDDELSFSTSYGLHRPDLGAVAAKLDGTASVTVEGLEWALPALGALVADVETVLGRPSSAAAMILPTGAAHVEEAARPVDVLVASVDRPLRVAVTEPDGERPTEQVVEPGRAVVVRRGRRARVVADDASMALRIALPTTHRWIEVVEASATARFHPLLRADLPTRLDRTIESYGGSLYERSDRWRAEVVTALSTTAHDHGAARARAQLAQRTSPGIGLLSAIRARHEMRGSVRSPLHAGAMVTPTGDRVALVAAGTVFSLADDVTAAVAPHLDGRPVAVDALTASMALVGVEEARITTMLCELGHRELMEPVA